MHIASHAMGCIHAIVNCICGSACIWQGQLPRRLLHSRDSNVHKQFEAPLSYGNTPSASAATEDINRHAAYLHDKVPTIANHLAIAQHRDRLRRAMKHTDDFVYLQHAKEVCTIQIPAREIILQVVEVPDNGIVLVQGKCGTTQPTTAALLKRRRMPHGPSA
jgi:inactivated superfamily I helicase